MELVYQLFRIYILCKDVANYRFSLQLTDKSSRNFVFQAFADVRIGRIACSYEELQGNPHLIIDTDPADASSTHYGGEQIECQAEYSCQFLFTFEIDGNSSENQGKDLEIAFLRYAQGILSHKYSFRSDSLS